jgi:hypothetical protein
LCSDSHFASLLKKSLERRVLLSTTWLDPHSSESPQSDAQANALDNAGSIEILGAAQNGETSDAPSLFVASSFQQITSWRFVAIEQTNEAEAHPSISPTIR